jgi:TRAP-type mannitol/chloroaromatic compound transport system substrate-binding protein
MKKIVKLLLGCIVVLVIAASARAAEPIRWRAATHTLPGTYRYKTLENFCEYVKKASNGRLEIQLYGGGVLFPIFDTFDSVRNGIVEMAMCSSAYWTGKDPQFGVLTRQPGSPIHDMVEGFYLEEKAYPIYEKLYKKFDITYLGCIVYAPPEILMMSTPIRTFADFKGKNIRSSGLGAIYYSKLGASAVSLSGPEIYTALQTKTIDAAEWTEWKENEDMGLLEAARYIMEPTYHQGTNEDQALIVNPAKWNALPKDLQDIVLLARDYVRWWSMVDITTQNTMAKQRWLARNKDGEIITLSPEDAAKCTEVAFELIVDQRKLGPEAEEFVNLYAKTLYELGYVKEAGILGYKP